MAFTFDGNAKTITTSQSTINVNDIYSRWKDWVLAGNAGFARAFAVIGGESIGGGLTAGVYLFLDNGWSIVLSGVSALTIQGNLVRSPDDSSGAALFQSATTILIRQEVSAVALGYTSGGASFTAADVWNYSTRTLTEGQFTAAGVRSALGMASANLDTQLADIAEDTGSTLPATLSAIQGSTFNTATDSLEAIRNRGDEAWTTGSSGEGGGATAEDIYAYFIDGNRPDIFKATGFSTHSPQDVWEYSDRLLTGTQASQLSSISNIPTNPLLTNDTRLNNLSNLDVAVSSRLPTSSYIAPDNLLTVDDQSRLLEVWQRQGLDSNNPVEAERIGSNVSETFASITLSHNVDGNVITTTRS